MAVDTQPNPKTILIHTPHTHIHRPVKAGTTWLCLSWELRFCMEHLSTSFYYRLRTDYPSPILLSRRVVLHSRLFPKSLRVSAPSLSSIPVLSLLLSSIMITMRVLVYALYLLNLSHSLYLSISYFLPLRQFFRACNGEIFAAHDVYNLSRR